MKNIQGRPSSAASITTAAFSRPSSARPTSALPAFYAVKCINRKNLNKTTEDLLINEIKLLKHIKHENIVEMFDFQVKRISCFSFQSFWYSFLFKSSSGMRIIFISLWNIVPVVICQCLSARDSSWPKLVLDLSFNKLVRICKCSKMNCSNLGLFPSFFFISSKLKQWNFYMIIRLVIWI